MSDYNCTPEHCGYPARAGIDVDINGAVWGGSGFDRHLEGCPSEPGWKAAQ